MAAAAKAVRISVVSDTVCPWCFVGKKNLCVTGGTNAQATRHRLTLSCSEKALASLPKTQATVEWKPYLLVPPSQWAAQPEALTTGVSKIAYYDQKFGKDQWKSFIPRLEAAFASAGVQGFTMDGKTGSSFNSHRLLTWTKETLGVEKQNELAEALFKRYFLRGLPMCDINVLTDAADEVGIAGARAFLESNAFTDEVNEELKYGRMRGISGVPHFIISCGDKEVEIGGAQPPQALARAIESVTA